jgi:hypothetical protein
MKLFELSYACRLYGEFTDFDSTYGRFLTNTTPTFDILDHRHRKALLVWLNSWGCRQFALNFHDKASEHLRNWGQENLTRLPPIGASLLILTDIDFVNVGTLYVGLRDLQASVRKRNGNSYPVTFGPTGAAKTLFALRNQAFPPWDESIRAFLGCDGTQKSYVKYLQWVRSELREVVTDAEAHGILASDIPNALSRPFSSLPKLIDEYNWVTITKGCKPPRLEDINNLWRWARPVEPAPDNRA